MVSNALRRSKTATVHSSGRKSFGSAIKEKIWKSPNDKKQKKEKKPKEVKQPRQSTSDGTPESGRSKCNLSMRSPQQSSEAQRKTDIDKTSKGGKVPLITNNMAQATGISSSQSSSSLLKDSLSGGNVDGPGLDNGGSSANIGSINDPKVNSAGCNRTGGAANTGATPGESHPTALHGNTVKPKLAHLATKSDLEELKQMIYSLKVDIKGSVKAEVVPELRHKLSLSIKEEVKNTIDSTYQSLVARCDNLDDLYKRQQETMSQIPNLVKAQIKCDLEPID